MKTFLFIFTLFCGLLSSSAEAACRGKIINPVTDVCWSCIFPIKLGGITLASGKNPDPNTGANTFCACTSGANIKVGMNMSFWEPLRTAEIVRQPYCFPSLGGLDLDVGIRAPAHGRTPSKTAASGRTSFYQVHWYFTPWLFVLEVLLDTDCLEQSAWDLAYMTELDPLWDDSVTTFFLIRMSVYLQTCPLKPHAQPTAWPAPRAYRSLSFIGAGDAAETFFLSQDGLLLTFIYRRPLPY